MAWPVEHAAVALSKYQVGDDGRTAYERLKGKKSQQETVEFGEKVHYRYNLKARSKDEKLEVKWDEGFFLGKWWRIGEAVIGAKDGILRAGTIRRVGGHRRWDREGLEQVRGVPWQWDPEQGEVHADLKVRWLTEEEWDRGGAVHGDEGKKVYRLRLQSVPTTPRVGLGSRCPLAWCPRGGVFPCDPENWARGQATSELSEKDIVRSCQLPACAAVVPLLDWCSA